MDDVDDYSIGLHDWMDVNPRFRILVTFLQELETATEAIIDRQRRVVGEQTEEEDLEVERYILREMFEEVLPRTLRYSTILHLYAALDVLLAKLCGHVESRTAASFSLSDMASPRQLATRLRYMKKALGAHLPDDAFDQGFGLKLSAFSKVRDCIAHAGGEVSGWKARADLPGMSRALGLTIEDDYIVVSRVVVTSFLEEARLWAVAVCRAVEKAVESAAPSRNSN